MATSQILMCFVILLFSLCVDTASERTEGRALLKWKNTLSNAHVLHSWSIANLDNICWNWTGINCNNVGDVYGITLVDFSLSGTLESFDFISFPNLIHFNLHNNSFIGSIPYAIANLSRLDFLDLSLNRFVNFIPPEIGRLRNLQFLNLGFNNLVGEIFSMGQFQQVLSSYQSLNNLTYVQTISMAQYLL
nr:receptor-like protein 12 [Ipomoea batatas]